MKPVINPKGKNKRQETEDINIKRMAIKFQYNKTSLQELNKQLRIRERALPILKNKESALRVEVKKAKRAADEAGDLLAQQRQEREEMARLWVEFDPSLVRIREVRLETKKIAGVAIPELSGIDFEEQSLQLYRQPAWIAAGRELIKEWTEMAIRKKVLTRKMSLLDHARKRTTQKVNLYEKVQIPAYEDAIRKIKRFLEDEENLAKSAQKIVKNRRAKAEDMEKLKMPARHSLGDGGEN